MFLWRTDETYPSIIIKYPPYLFFCYRNDPKLSERPIWANSAPVDPDQTAPDRSSQEQSDPALQCLPYRLHLLDALFYGKVTLFKFKGDYSNFTVYSQPSDVLWNWLVGVLTGLQASKYIRATS